MKNWLIFFVFSSFLNVFSQERLLEHPQALDIVKKGLFHIYNAEGPAANLYIDQVEELLPAHPVGPMMRALNTNWSSNPLEIGSPEFIKMNGHLQLSLARTKKLLDRDPKHLEAVFFAMAINSWLAQFYDEGGATFKALNAAKKAYHFMKLGFDMLDESPEFQFSTGLYNYYRVQYPESNPIYKPFMWFFRSGNKKLGLEQLERASKIATFTKAEAAMYLAHLNLRYERNPHAAVKFSGQLVQDYPNNVFFKINYTEALLAAKDYQKALPLVQDLAKEKKSFYKMSGEVFYGVYLEYEAHDDKNALQWYRKSLETGQDLGPRSHNKKSLAHAGVARLLAKSGDTEQARVHYKKALKLAQYDTVKDEAKAYLRDS